MFSNFSEFFTCVKEARFTFDVMIDSLISLFHSVVENPNVSAVWDGLVNFVMSFRSVFTVAAVCFCLAVAFFGKKMMGFLKFIACFVVGFALGTHLLVPLLPPEIDIPAWITGVVVALIVAVLYRFIYIILYVGIAGYGMYILAFYGFFLHPNAVYTHTRAVACAIAALVAIVIVLLFRKYLEMIGTSILGAWAATLLFANFAYDFTAWSLFSGMERLAIFIPTALIAAIGTAVQIKTRRRY